ncbi:MAG: TVP38/TMEM64 family protein [Deltaproteobacteria bacterium]
MTLYHLSAADFSSIQSTVNYINSFGIYGPTVTFVLFVIQAIAPIVPYVIIAGAAGMIYGYFTGFFLAWSGALVGACILYWLSKSVARDFFIDHLKDKYDFDLKSVDEAHVFWILFICRIFPVVPTVLINIGSGIGGVSNTTFIISSALGKLPWAIIYVALGDYFMKSHDITGTLTIIGVIFLVSIICMRLLRQRMPFRHR